MHAPPSDARRSFRHTTGPADPGRTLTDGDDKMTSDKRFPMHPLLVWTTRPERDGTHAVVRGGIKYGEVSIHASGYVDWSFCAGSPRPSAKVRKALAAAILEAAR